MRKRVKKASILEAIIKEYLKHNNPIGSNELSMKLEFDISASTIRLYFKELANEGALKQTHISGGRIPTTRAMSEYWRQKIDTSKELVIDDFERFKSIIKNSGLYCVVKFDDNNRLKEVIEVSNRYLILVFDECEVVIEHHPKVKILLEEFLGLGIEQLKEIVFTLGLEDVATKLGQTIIKDRLYMEGLINLLKIIEKDKEVGSRFLKPSIIDYIDDGLYFNDIVPNGYMAIKREAFIEDESAKMLCLGQLFYDYEDFFKQIGG
jgi:heat-inducible transcriptional repressor